MTQGIGAAKIPACLSDAIEALKTVPRLANAPVDAAFEPPVTAALARLILDEFPREQ